MCACIQHVHALAQAHAHVFLQQAQLYPRREHGICSHDMHICICICTCHACMCMRMCMCACSTPDCSCSWRNCRSRAALCACATSSSSRAACVGRRSVGWHNAWRTAAPHGHYGTVLSPMHACLPTRLPTYPPAYLPTNLSAHVAIHLSIYRSIRLHPPPQLAFRRLRLHHRALQVDAACDLRTHLGGAGVWGQG